MTAPVCRYSQGKEKVSTVLSVGGGYRRESEWPALMTDPLPGHVLRLQVPPLHFGPQLVRLAGSSGGPGPSLHAAPRSFCANDGCADGGRGGRQAGPEQVLGGNEV